MLHVLVDVAIHLACGGRNGCKMAPYSQGLHYIRAAIGEAR